ncbi:hypothetical protein VNI00_011201 [Paramarasmius palmivorus]|uniref:HMG domain-containing protein n=1 Tax=Paramarasmius palmivorus TaxID=297713 RepID=A0AAW0CBP8_9AGAR
MFWHETVGWADGTVLMRFSVEGVNGALNNRAVVIYEGLENGWGSWRCSKDKKEKNCLHIQRARKFLGEVLGTSLSDELRDGELAHSGDELESTEQELTQERAVSFLPILPPPWASLPTDPALYTRPHPAATVPNLLALTSDRSGTACGNRACYDPLQDKIRRECIIYTLTGYREATVELQACPSCPKRHHCYIGPETRDVGIFNYNNNVFFTHELLDEYTSRFASSETPFAAFVQSIGRIYQGRGFKFVGDDLFRSAWFAYATLQSLEQDMKCPRCGDMPETVIWDGVTLAFSKKHLKDCLKPPTNLGKQSLVRERRYLKNPQWIPLTTKGDKTLRKAFISLLRGSSKGTRSRLTSAESDSEVGGEGKGEGVEATKRKVLASFTERIRIIAPAVAETLAYALGPGSQIDRKLSKKYTVLLEQLVAEESAIQMVNENTLEKLQGFVKDPTLQNASNLVDIPALLLVIEGELRLHGNVPRHIYDLCVWMCARAEEVLNGLKRGQLETLGEMEANGVEDWRKPPSNSRPAKVSTSGRG